MALAAVVVCHDQEESRLSETLAALAGQTVSNLEIIQVAANGQNFENALANSLFDLTEYEWVWALSDFQVPQANALEQMLAKAETSVTAAIIAPKILEQSDSKIISNYGLSLTPRGSLYRVVNHEIDQSQFDGITDVLGVNLEGALISPGKIAMLGGFKNVLSGEAADLELGIRARLRGFRILLAPKAKILGYNPNRISKRTADLALKLFYYPAVFSFMFWLLLPLLVVVESLLLMLKKQPERVGAELAAGFKAFFTAGKVWLGRKNLTSSERRAFRSLRPLFATREQVAERRRIDNEPEVDSATTGLRVLESSQAGFFESAAGWIAAALLVVSWQYWPLASDVSGPALLPLGDNWLKLYTATGSSFQNLGMGFLAPSEPFNWLLLLIGSVTFWNPGVALTLLVFFAKSLAFITAFKLFSLVSKRPWVVVLAALAYALWPSFSEAQSQGRLPQVVAHVMLPIAIYALVRVLALGQQISRQSSWAFTATSALAVASVSIAVPSLTLWLALFWFGALLRRPKKIGYLVWVPALTLVLWLPTIWYRVVGLFKPMSVLADVSLPLATKKLEPIGLVAGTWQSSWFWVCLIAVLVLILLATLALFTKRTAITLLASVTAVLALTSAWIFEQVQFVGNAVAGNTVEPWVNGAPHSWLSLFALAACVLVAVVLDQIKLRKLAGVVLSASVLLLASFALVLPSQLTYGDSRVVPALVRAEAEQGSSLRMLEISTQDGEVYSATIINSDGIHLADLNTSYRFALQNQDNDVVARLAADLVSGSSADVGNELLTAGIGYVLVTDVSTEVSRSVISQIDSVRGLKSIGDTEYGQLWRVSYIEKLPIARKTETDLWSLTKGIQLVAIALFALLAIPNRRMNPRVKTDSDHDSFAPESDEADD